MIAYLAPGDLLTLAEAAALIEPNPALQRALVRALIEDLGEAALIPAHRCGFAGHDDYITASELEGFIERRAAQAVTASHAAEESNNRPAWTAALATMFQTINAPPNPGTLRAAVGTAAKWLADDHPPTLPPTSDPAALPPVDSVLESTEGRRPAGGAGSLAGSTGAALAELRHAPRRRLLGDLVHEAARLWAAGDNRQHAKMASDLLAQPRFAGLAKTSVLTALKRHLKKDDRLALVRGTKLPGQCAPLPGGCATPSVEARSLAA